MKLRYKILVLAVVLAGGAVFAGSKFESVKAAARKVVYNLRFDDGLVGYWSFNGKDMSGVTAIDRGSGGNNGTLTGGPVSTEGVVGQALNFDGSDDYIDAGSAGSTLTDNFTVSAWVKGTTVNRRIVARRTSVGGTQWEIYAKNTTGVLTLYDGTAERSSNTNVADGAWHFVVTVVNGASSQHYVDGSASGSTFTPSISAQVLNTGIGGWSDGSATTIWNGPIDEVRIYNRALSAAEIAYQYARTKPAGSGTVAKSVANDNGLVGYWDFDDCDTCTTVTDRSGNGNTGTMYNAAGPTEGDLHTASGKIGRGASFAGGDDYISIPQSWTFGANYSISAWLKTSNAGTMPIVSNRAGSGHVYFGMISGKAFLYENNCVSPDLTGNKSINDNQFHLYTFVMNGSPLTRSIYIDGILDKSDTPTDCPSNTGTDLRISNDADNADYFIGTLDDVRIYNRALSAAEIKNLYNSTRKMFVNMPQNNLLTDGLVGFWSFNGPDMSGVTAIDRSGSGNNGTLTGGPVAEEGVIGQGLNFDGSNDNVDAGTPATFDFGTGSFSVSAFFRMPSGFSSLNRAIISKNSGAGPSDGGFSLYTSAAGTDVNFAVWDGTNQANSTKTVTVSDANWHHAVGTFDGTAKTSTLYVDGINATPNTNASLGSVNNTTRLFIGAWNSPSGVAGSALANGGMGGAIDEVRIYNRALSAGEVLKLYNAGKR